MNENAERWLSFAREDLMAARAVLREGLSNQACFHAQQCAEKCLKAMVAQSGLAPPRTHSIQELVNRLPPTTLTCDADDLAELDDYYIPTRYPDALPGMLPDGLPTEGDANRAVAIASDVLADIERYMAL